MMMFFQSELEQLGQLASRNSLSQNLLIWSNWISFYSVQYPNTRDYQSIGFGNLQSFQMSSDAKYIFNSFAGGQYFGTKYGTCAEFDLTSYDLANGNWLVDYYDVEVLQRVASCKMATSSLYLKNVFDTEANSTQLSFNVQSFMTAAAVSSGIQDLISLKPVGDNSLTIDIDNYKFLIRFVNTNLQVMCFIIAIIDIVLLPIC